jgi:cytochrome c biogenesis factor
MVVLGGTTTPILFQRLVSKDVLIGAPSFHGIIILIFTSLLLVLVYIHFRGFISSMNKTKRIILVRARPILLPNIIRKSSPQTRAKNIFILFFISYFHFFIFKFIGDLSYLESFCTVLCFLLSCIFPLSSNYRHDRLANKEHKLRI